MVLLYQKVIKIQLCLEKKVKYCTRTSGMVVYHKNKIKYCLLHFYLLSLEHHIILMFKVSKDRLQSVCNC